MKKYIGIGVVIIAVAISYFFLVYLPYSQRQNFVFNKQKECRNVCETIYKEEEKSMSDAIMLNPQYFYNEEKNVCYYSGGFMGTEITEKYVTNCFTNEIVVRYTKVGEKVFGITEEEFKNKKKGLIKSE